MLADTENKLLGILLGMGASLTVKDFRIAFKKPQGARVGRLCQYAVMPFLGHALVLQLDFCSGPRGLSSEYKVHTGATPATAAA